MNLIKLILAKLLSGKYFLTIASGIAFLFCVIHRILTPEAIVGILMFVFQSYFNKKSENSDTTTQK
jgi:hypothetical protein